MGRSILVPGFPLLVAFLLGQETGGITGLVVAEESGEPLAEVNVMVKNSFIGTASDVQGQFTLPELVPGTYSLVVSRIGYRQQIIENLSVEAGAVRHLEVRLEQDVLYSPQVIVTASRREQDIMESPLSVAVIGPRQIRERAAVSLVEVLPYEAGVNTVKGQLNIRGATGYTLGAGNRSLLLLDGVPLLGSAAGNITWSVVPTSEIEQVEIIKSGGSALYGSSAMGGVVNVITRNAAATPETRLRVKLGAYSDPKYAQWRWREGPGWFYTTELTHSRPLGSNSTWIRFQRHSSDGYTQLNWTDSYNLTGKIKYNWGTRYNAALYGNFFTDESGLASQWKSAAHPLEAPLGDEQDYGRGSKLNLNGFFNLIHSPAVVMKVRGSLYKVKWRNYGRTNRDYSDENRIWSEYQVSTTWSPALNTIAGAVYQRASIDAQIFGIHTSHSRAAYLLGQGRLGQRLTVSAGGRWEDYRVDGKTLDQTLAPQLALNWKGGEGLSLRSSVTRGFRVPTVAELYSRAQLNIFQVEPNPGLQAETSLSYEAGATVILPGKGGLFNLKLDGALFQARYENLIEPLPDEVGVIHFENITRARITGAELGLVAGLFSNRSLISLAYTWLDPVELAPDGTVTDTLSYRFRHTLVTTASAYLGGYSGHLEYRYSSRLESVELFEEDPITQRDHRVPIHLWNLSLGYGAENWELLLRVENLFQYYYVELERNLGTERNLALNFSWSF